VRYFLEKIEMRWKKGKSLNRVSKLKELFISEMSRAKLGRGCKIVNSFY
jgi:hypothetical protein